MGRMTRRAAERGALPAALGAALLALCGLGRAAAPPEPRPSAGAVRGQSVQHISVWMHQGGDGAEFSAVRRAADAFNRGQRAYRVDLAAASYTGNYTERVHGAAATGTLPCLLEFDGPYLYGFAWRGYLQPIDRYMPRTLLDDVLPSVIAQGTYDGRLYSLGQFESGLGLWGNRAHLRAAGVRIPTFARPWTLAEFERALERLGAVAGVDYPLDMSFYASLGEFYSYAYAPLLQGFGGDLIERRHYRSAKGVLDGAASVAAMRHLQRWLARGWTRVVQDRADDFARRRAALLWNGHWHYPALRKALGDDLLLLPLPDFGRGSKTATGSWNWGITASCPFPAGAGAFLAHLMSTAEVLRISNANGAIPARRSSLARSPLYGAGGPLRLYARQISAGRGITRPVTPAYEAIGRAFSQAVGAIAAGGDAQAELSKAAAAIDRDLAAHRHYPLR
ncbi:extracellular solute-binding protein [Pseudoduganella namucuonensis]|uniref:Carbohydrate ABC transporter substrate-binding protein, CUT1 family n=1 Tax=Pseudoduganella namucuonensis TaxID=1035707 RepID=A0A1I7JPC7_9BURK|nr:extracellular solute-binding protein [Pseudoduganella namucuonensis]SFU87022.1 carbohydrate ABC transporter substrate-binding protein, CUT1 family [Pseudoduganella namucuonensis]